MRDSSQSTRFPRVATYGTRPPNIRSLAGRGSSRIRLFYDDLHFLDSVGCAQLVQAHSFSISVGIGLQVELSPYSRIHTRLFLQATSSELALILDRARQSTGMETTWALESIDQALFQAGRHTPSAKQFPMW